MTVEELSEYLKQLVGWGLEHRTLQSIRAIGVDHSLGKLPEPELTHDFF